MVMKLRIDDRSMRRFVKTMPAASKRSVARSLNKAITQTRTLAAREVSSKRNILVGRAKREMRLVKASPARPSAAIVASGSPISIMDVKGAKRQTKAGVKAKIDAGAAPHLFKGAFIAIMKSGHVGVFRRARDRSLPIKEIKLPSVSATMVQENIEDRLRLYAVPIYEKELIRLLNLEMTKAGAK